MNRKRLRQIINEEISTNDVKNIIRDELKKKDFEKLVKKITAEVIEDMYRVLYQHSGMWKSLTK